MSKQSSLLRTGLMVLSVVFLMTACNLGEQAPSEPVNLPDSETDDFQEPLGDETDLQVTPPTATPAVNILPTNTPVPELLPWEKLGPIAIDGFEHRSQEPITVRVTRGSQVDSVTCFWEIQGMGETGQMTLSTSNASADGNTYEDVYTFTPEAAGTYAINCTGTAATTAGPQGVNAKSSSFTVEAKG